MRRFRTLEKIAITRALLTITIEDIAGLSDKEQRIVLDAGKDMRRKKGISQNMCDALVHVNVAKVMPEDLITVNDIVTNGAFGIN